MHEPTVSYPQLIVLGSLYIWVASLVVGEHESLPWWMSAMLMTVVFSAFQTFDYFHKKYIAHKILKKEIDTDA